MEEDLETPNPFKHIIKVVPQLVVGGTQSPAQDLSIFLSNSPNFLVGTPGRLLELLSSQYVHCPQSAFEILVLDEADRLLDLGFKEDLQRILGRLPKQRRTGLFSASVSEAVDQIIRVGLRNPVRISVKVKSETGEADKRTPASLQMSYIITKPQHKIPALAQLLERLEPRPQKVIIYLSTCAAVDYFQHMLPEFTSFTIVPLHGKHQPKVRIKNFKRFSDSVAPTVLLTTDVAARGLDIPLVDLVVQIDPPSDPKVFLHRCGRAGRAGRRGLAVTLLTPGREEDYVSFLSVRKTPISQLSNPVIEITDADAKSVTDKIRKIVLADRALHDKAQKAFVSWVKSYSKHQASSIFKVSEFDWRDLADAWGLLKLPRMPELKNWGGDIMLGLDVDFDTYQYKDSAREKHRLDGSHTADTRPTKKREDTRSWSDKKTSKEERIVNREKRQAKRAYEKNSALSADEIREKEELAKMIAQVRKQTSEAAADDWEGFD
jgi:ATP-dependent RNA helicase DDX55/SPB4